jgi:hypothetical protein
MGNATAILNQAASDILDELTDGVDASFVPLAGDPVTLTVYLDTDLQNEPIGYEMQATGTQQTILARLADLPAVPVAAIPGTPGGIFTLTDATTLDETEYAVTAILENDGIFVLCAVKEID